MTAPKPKIWVPGDWNAFFGFGTNILVNLLVLTGLLRFVLKMPDELVFGRILPATGLMLCLSTLYYARLAYKLAEKTGRDDVCALGAIAALIIDRAFVRASAFALVGAVLTFLGFMHGEAIGIGQSPTVAASYLAVSGVLLVCAKFALPATAPMPVHTAEPHPVAVAVE